MCVLDTHIVSELRKAGAGRADGTVVARASEAATGTLYISAITLLELEPGVLSLERRDAAGASSDLASLDA